MNAEVEQILDEVLAPGCGGCGRSLPRPGVRCESCGAFPDVTREEFARQLLQPGELSLHRADVADRAAEALRLQFVAASAAPDRYRALAELEIQAAEVQDAFREAVAARELALEAATAAENAETETRKPLDHLLGLEAKLQEELTEAQRTWQGDEAEKDEKEWHINVSLAELRPFITRRQQAADDAAAVTVQRHRELREADLNVADCEQARDEDAAARLDLDEVHPSPERIVLLAKSFREVLADLLLDQDSPSPQCDTQYAVAMGLVYEMAGALGLLGLAEEGAMPRVLDRLAGPMSRAEDVAMMAARLPQNRLALPPGPGESSMTLLSSKLT